MKSFKTLFTVLALVLMANFSSAQAKNDWKEKNDFHKVMSQTFHPAEEGNFAPIRSRINEMLDKAEAFKNSEIPAEFSHQKEIKNNLKKLVKQTKSFKKKINKGASDADLKADFIALHDTFHQVVGLCKAEDEHQH